MPEHNDEHWIDELAGHRKTTDRATTALRRVLLEHAEQSDPHPSEAHWHRRSALRERLLREGLLDPPPPTTTERRIVAMLRRWLLGDGSGGMPPYPALAGGLAVLLVAVLVVPPMLDRPDPWVGLDLPDMSEDFLDHPIGRSPFDTPAVITVEDRERTVAEFKFLFMEHAVPYRVTEDGEDRVIEARIGEPPDDAIADLLRRHDLEPDEAGVLEVLIRTSGR